jgi:hypothetical protein
VPTLTKYSSLKDGLLHSRAHSKTSKKSYGKELWVITYSAKMFRGKWAPYAPLYSNST